MSTYNNIIKYEKINLITLYGVFLCTNVLILEQVYDFSANITM